MEVFTPRLATIETARTGCAHPHPDLPPSRRGKGFCRGSFHAGSGRHVNVGDLLLPRAGTHPHPGLPPSRRGKEFGLKGKDLDRRGERARLLGCRAALGTTFGGYGYAKKASISSRTASFTSSEANAASMLLRASV